jgi:hypothetical protein
MIRPCGAIFVFGRSQVEICSMGSPTEKSKKYPERGGKTSTGAAIPLSKSSMANAIAFKLQGWVNNPRRTQDLEDIHIPLA